MAEDPRILIVLTSHGVLGNTGKPTGLHYEELATPYYAFQEGRLRVDLASIRGGEPPHDPGSLKFNPEDNPLSVQRFREDVEAMKKLRSTMAVHEVNAENYIGIYLPGGHGAMWDFPESSSLADIITEMYADGKVVAAICHGPAGLLNAVDRDTRSFLVKGKQVNSFTDEEERAVGKGEAMPFLLESKLRERGAVFKKSGKFQPFVVRDGRLITGQNPASAQPLAEKVLEAVRELSGNRRSAA